MSNVLRLEDKVEVTIFSPSLGPVWFPAIVKGFPGSRIYVVAEEQSDDPLVENEWELPWSHVRRREVNSEKSR